jgi:hypothetical protein
MVYHMLHDLANTTGMTLGLYPVRKEQSFPGLSIGTTVATLQADGKEFSVHIRLYMDTRNSLPVCKRRESIWLCIPSGPGAVLRQGCRAKKVHPCETLHYVALQAKSEVKRRCFCGFFNSLKEGS